MSIEKQLIDLSDDGVQIEYTPQDGWTIWADGGFVIAKSLPDAIKAVKHQRRKGAALAHAMKRTLHQ